MEIDEGQTPAAPSQTIGRAPSRQAAANAHRKAGQQINTGFNLEPRNPAASPSPGQISAEMPPSLPYQPPYPVRSPTSSRQLNHQSHTLCQFVTRIIPTDIVLARDKYLSTNGYIKTTVYFRERAIELEKRPENLQSSDTQLGIHSGQLQASCRRKTERDAVTERYAGGWVLSGVGRLMRNAMDALHHNHLHNEVTKQNM